MKSRAMVLATAAAVLGGWLAGSCAMAAAPAEPAGAAALSKFLEHELETFTELEEKGVSAAELTKRFYWPEAVLTGEGVPKAARSPAEVAALIGSVGGDVGVCHHAKYNPIVYSGRVASLILEYTCHPPAGKPALQFNTIYVWEKRGKDWKIITEMYVSGSLH